MAIRPALIALLAEGPCHGYELKARFEERTGGAWPLNIGQVYTTLQRLERDGLVEETGPDGTDGERRVWRLTDAGAVAARTWYATAVEAEALPRDEMAARVVLALDAPDVEALDVLQTQRAAAVAHVQALRRLRREREERGAGRGILALIDLSLLHAEAEVRWLDLVEQRLGAAATLGGPAR